MLLHEADEKAKDKGANSLNLYKYYIVLCIAISL